MNLNFTFTSQQAQVILNALASRPYAEVSGLVEVFLSQAREQEVAAEQAAAQEAAITDITDVKEI